MARPRGVLFDIDGVVVTSWEPLPGAAEAVRRVRAAGHPVAFVTNTTSRAAADVAGSLTSAGIEVAAGHLVTAGIATASWLREQHAGARCLVLNDGPSDDLGGVDVVDPTDPGAEDADVVVVGSGGPTFSWDAVNRAARALQRGAALVAMHGSMAWRTAEGLCVDGGAYVALLESATGTTATVVGKPAPELFLAGARVLDRDPHEVVMVGDDVHSDVLAAQALGMTGVLVRTGKFRPEVLAAAPGRPDVVVDSVADLPDLLERLGPVEHGI